MEIITISREFGSGGRELGEEIAAVSGFDFYDREIINAVANKNHLDRDYVEKELDNYANQAYPRSLYRSLNFIGYMQTDSIKLLLQQKEIIEEIASKGRDFVIVGRNADIILKDYNPFKIFVCANMDTKIKRCMERKGEGENFTEKELIHRMKQIDKMRAKSRELLFGGGWGQRENYHLTLNTTDWNIKELASALSDFIRCGYRRKQ